MDPDFSKCAVVVTAYFLLLSGLDSAESFVRPTENTPTFFLIGPLL